MGNLYKSEVESHKPPQTQSCVMTRTKRVSMVHKILSVKSEKNSVIPGCVCLQRGIDITIMNDEKRYCYSLI